VVVVVVAAGTDVGPAALCRTGLRSACDALVAQDADSAINAEATRALLRAGEHRERH
jgi:hypothetical protein